jgi:hypothetical protein
VAQFGRALRSGRRGRPFESGRFDEKEEVQHIVLNLFFFVEVFCIAWAFLRLLTAALVERAFGMAGVSGGDSRGPHWPNLGLACKSGEAWARERSPGVM